ncbi:hypothetical protein [Clostridium beijerinckii]|uniref:hypothetical protein n=1 Tax=Clostridium beijerinckii TaxID=1520 RepID=UPI00156EC851|nr:hypothetical protein [Clostridium beijerinckii]NRU52516.1 hypothetical protein [Clostridium beijerinckii]NYC69395.1 hypothetical protein [Clostridium beijerinckii]NYC91717.1 hypothetical protein [Clostridium beijerinckii]
MRIENVRVKAQDIRERLSSLTDFKICKNNGTIVFSVNGKASFLSRRTSSVVITLFTIKVLDKNNQLKYTYCLNFKNSGKEIELSNLGKSNNTAMEEYIIKEVKDNILVQKLRLRKSKAEVFFNTWEECYYLN